ncbi:histidine phosphotransferase [Prochlorococcus sp. MIT 1223]|uniref:histidine phosphotransferase n=1 Tax=Prochlorococcus sp. MIT 1223 TaxID=3096217 RepID=UPI002A759DDF|nr:histidine phosphotransferase [Prochlorococcus sp. MIT 1223]
MPFENQQRLTRRRSSAGPTPPRRPLGGESDSMRQGPRPTFLTLRDHGKVYVAELPNLSDGQLAHISKEVEEVLESLERRIQDLQQETSNGFRDNDTLIKATTKHEVTQRFISAIQDEQEHRRNNPALKDAASESLPLTFLEVARHRLPGATFDSLLREALEACAQDEKAINEDVLKDKTSSSSIPEKIIDLPSPSQNGMPVVVSPDS